MITDWVGGVQKGQNIDYVIFERSLMSMRESKTYNQISCEWDTPKKCTVGQDPSI